MAQQNEINDKINGGNMVQTPIPPPLIYIKFVYP